MTALEYAALHMKKTSPILVVNRSQSTPNVDGPSSRPGPEKKMGIRRKNSDKSGGNTGRANKRVYSVRAEEFSPYYPPLSPRPPARTTTFSSSAKPGDSQPPRDWRPGDSHAPLETPPSPKPNDSPTNDPSAGSPRVSYLDSTAEVSASPAVSTSAEGSPRSAALPSELLSGPTMTDSQSPDPANSPPAGPSIALPAGPSLPPGPTPGTDNHRPEPPTLPPTTSMASGDMPGVLRKVSLTRHSPNSPANVGLVVETPKPETPDHRPGGGKGKAKAKTKAAPGGRKFGAAVPKATTATGLRTKDASKMVENMDPYDAQLVYTVCNFSRAACITDPVDVPSVRQRDEAVAAFMLLYSAKLQAAGRQLPVATAAAHLCNLSAGQLVSEKSKKEGQKVAFLAQFVCRPLILGVQAADPAKAKSDISDCHFMRGDPPVNLKDRLQPWCDEAAEHWTWSTAVALWENGRAETLLTDLVTAMGNGQRNPADDTFLAPLAAIKDVISC